MNLLRFTKRCLNFAKNQLLDLKYHGHFMGITIKTKYKKTGANDSGYTSYHVLDHIFEGRISENDIFVDVGCAKGRVIAWFLARGFKNRIIGIELDNDIAKITSSHFKGHKNVTIISGSVLERFPEEGTIFYLFNPFKEDILRKFKGTLEVSANRYPHIQVLYYNCQYISVFEEDPKWTVVYIPMRFKEDGKCALITPK